MESLGTLTLNQCLPMLNQIAYEHELKLNLVRDFRIAVFILKCRMFTSC